MSDNDNCIKTIRARFSGVSINPENREYGDDHKSEYALLNGCDPADRTMTIPEASATLRVKFPAGVDFPYMARVMEQLEQAVRLALVDMEVPA